MSRISGLADGSLKVARGELGSVLGDEDTLLSYEVSREDELYIYRFGVWRGGRSSQKSFIEFASSGIHEDLFQELVKIVERFGLDEFRVTYLSDLSVDLRDAIESVEAYDEAEAFTFLLKINDEGYFSSDEDRRGRALEHVEKWRGKSLNETQRQQYFSPVLDQWEVDTFKSLYCSVRGRREVLTGCHEREFRKLYNFLSTLAERGFTDEESSFTVSEALEDVPDRDHYFFEERSTVSKLPIHHDNYRTFLLSLTLSDLEYLSSAVEPSGNHAFSSLGAIRVSNLYLEYFHARAESWWPSSSSFAEFIEAVPEVEDLLHRADQAARITFQAFIVSPSIVNMFRELVEDQGESFEQVQEVVFGHAGWSKCVRDGSFAKIYVIESLLETVGSSTTVFDILKSVGKAEGRISLLAWEEYIANWEAFQGTDPVMTLQILDGGIDS